MHSRRFLGLDYGSKNVGLAISDEMGILVSPLPSVPYQSRNSLVERLKTLIEERAVAALVVGLPVNMDGTFGDAAQRVRRFMDVLRQEVAVPVLEFDERLSTVEASEIWRDMKARQQRKYRTVDSLAAALILERYLKESSL